MSGWSERELLLIGAANEIIIAPERGDSTPRPAVPIWVVRVGDELYVRSYRGPSGGWYRRARVSGNGRIRIRLPVVGQPITAELADNPTAQDLASQLPMT